MLNAKLSRWARLIWVAFLPFGAEAHHSFAATFNVEVIEELEGVGFRDQRWRRRGGHTARVGRRRTATTASSDNATEDKQKRLD